MAEGVGNDLAVGLGLRSHVAIGTVVHEEVRLGWGSSRGDGARSLPRLFRELEMEGVYREGGRVVQGNLSLKALHHKFNMYVHLHWLAWLSHWLLSTCGDLCIKKYTARFITDIKISML